MYQRLPAPTSLLATCSLVLAAGCSGESTSGPASSVALTGTWRAVLASPGGELPFRLDLRSDNGPTGVLWHATIHNAEERIQVDRVAVRDQEIELTFSGYDSEILATLGSDADGPTLEGRWRKTGADGNSTLDFHARRVPNEPTTTRVRFHQPAPADWSVDGRWTMTFTDEDGDFSGLGILRQIDSSGSETTDRVEGTIRTTTGDYRYLEGEVEGDELLLSTFDGAHAFLFRARRTSDGSLIGEFWSRDSYHATFVAEPAGPDEDLPDGWQQVGLRNDDGRFTFAFTDLDGELLRHNDPRFDGKVVLVELFGSWCPNCNDSAPILARWFREDRARGLEIVGLAFEMTGRVERDREFVRRFRDRHGIEYPLLLAGTSDKEKAGEQLPDLSAVLSFPTKILIDRGGRVQGIHSGFDGPGTGEAHDRLLTELRSEIDRLLEEAPPGNV